MHIPPYQIHNVLKAYSKQLIRHGDYRKSGREKVRNGIMISAGEKRQMVIDKIATIIVNKITNMNTEEADLEALAAMDHRGAARSRFKKTEFFYHAVDKADMKKRCRFRVENVENGRSE